MSEPQQTWDAQRYAQNAAFVPALGRDVLALLAPQTGERILDLGCGDGVLTEALVAAGATVVGVDSSPDMVAAARARGLDAHVVDGQALAQTRAFDGTFDAVFTNAAMHWMPDHDAVIRGVAGLLRPGGRFVGELGGFGNVAALRVAAAAVLSRRGRDAARLSLWTFPTAEDFAARLSHHGFAIERCVLFPRPTRLPTDAAGWLDTFARAYLDALPEGERIPARTEMVALLEPVLKTPAGEWWADYVRLRFSAMRPEAPTASPR